MLVDLVGKHFFIIFIYIFSKHQYMEFFTTPEAWISLLTLTLLEIVLGIDNIVFISILSGKLPANQQEKARKLGLGLAMITRVLLLLSLSWVMSLTSPLFNIGEWVSLDNKEWLDKLAISGRDLILISGGLFLIYKSTHEIHLKLEGEEDEEGKVKVHSFAGVIAQILVLDIVFSLDSVITAIGMAEHVEIMIAAVVIAVLIMMVSANAISGFVNNHPTVKMLALSFLLLIGVSLLAEGLDQHIPKGYIYFAMAFSILVEMLNLKMKKNTGKPLELKNNAKENKV
jgi:predicted tellurium resistance membrane protein TerC